VWHGLRHHQHRKGFSFAKVSLRPRKPVIHEVYMSPKLSSPTDGIDEGRRCSDIPKKYKDNTTYVHTSSAGTKYRLPHVSHLSGYTFSADDSVNVRQSPARPWSTDPEHRSICRHMCRCNMHAVCCFMLCRHFLQRLHVHASCSPVW
jgi:hypothetical protein